LKHGNNSKTWRSFLPTGPSLWAAKARAIGDLLHDTKIELLDDLTLLRSRLMILLSTRLLASRGEDALQVFLTVSF
jgi:hypothetical protein